jgi:hypothetical protein
LKLDNIKICYLKIDRGVDIEKRILDELKTLKDIIVTRLASYPVTVTKWGDYVNFKELLKTD